MADHKNIVVIPARKNSKRLPGKNLLLVAGVPLVTHSIRYAKLNKDLFKEIIVSTDDPKIKKIALEEGVVVVERPSHLSTDISSTVSALKHVLEVIHDKIENVFLLQPTNPLRPKSLLKEAYKKFNQDRFDSLMTVTRSYKKLGKIENERFIPFNYFQGQRSQDLEPLYYENGLLYITKASLIMEEKILGEKNFPFIIDHPYANVDIDTKDDLDIAEFFHSKYL